MDAFLIEAAKTNSPAMILAAILFVGLYYVIKGQREKTATKRDGEKRDLELKIALQDKDIENLKATVKDLGTRWETIQGLLSKINENLASILTTISALEDRIDRIERRADDA